MNRLACSLFVIGFSALSQIAVGSVTYTPTVKRCVEDSFAIFVCSIEKTEKGKGLDGGTVTAKVIEKLKGDGIKDTLELKARVFSDFSGPFSSVVQPGERYLIFLVRAKKDIPIVHLLHIDESDKLHTGTYRGQTVGVEGFVGTVAAKADDPTLALTEALKQIRAELDNVARREKSADGLP